MPVKKNKMMGLITPMVGRMVNQESFSVPGDISDHSRVLIVDSGDLTELLFFAPVIHYLKHRFPQMRLSVLVREGNGELIRTMHQISEMISYEPEHLSLTSTTYLTLLNRLKTRDFDIVFLLGKEFSFVRSLLAVLSRARLRVGFSQEFTYPYINCEIRPSSNGNLYEAPRAAGYLAALGLSPGDSMIGWSLPAQDARWARQMIHFRNTGKDTMVIAVDPGVGKGRHRLVETSFARVVDRIGRQYGARIMLLSNNLSAKAIDRFRSLLSVDILDVEPKNVKEGLALLSCADLVLAGNTDFFHFAVSMRRPTIGFFTRYDKANWVPKGTPWVQIIQGVKGQKLPLDELVSKIDTLLHLTDA